MAADDPHRLRRDDANAPLVAGRRWRRAAADAALETRGLSDATVLPLVLIGRMGGGPRRNALAEAAGLAVREENPIDRRAEMLSLTPVGEAVDAKEADLGVLRETVFATASDADLQAGPRVFQAIQGHVREAAGARPGEAAA